MKEFRKEYGKKSLDESQVLRDPMAQFKSWFDEAKEADLNEPNKVVLSTANAAGRVSSRIVLLKEMTTHGLVIYSNYQSQKAQDMAENPSVSLLFFWEELERQVRVEGQAQKISRERSQGYFDSRPRGSRLGAWTSPQSQRIESRQDLEKMFQATIEKFEGIEDIPVPDFWGGYEITPDRWEFWQGGENRLHDRIAYLQEDNSWKIHRLAP